MAGKNRGQKKNKVKLHRRIMREKLAVMIIIILLAFAGLCVRLVTITRENQTSKKVITIKLTLFSNVLLNIKIISVHSNPHKTMTYVLALG